MGASIKNVFSGKNSNRSRSENASRKAIGQERGSQLQATNRRPSSSSAPPSYTPIYPNLHDVQESASNLYPRLSVVENEKSLPDKNMREPSAPPLDEGDFNFHVPSRHYELPPSYESLDHSPPPSYEEATSHAPLPEKSGKGVQLSAPFVEDDPHRYHSVIKNARGLREAVGYNISKAAKQTKKAVASAGRKVGQATAQAYNITRTKYEAGSKHTAEKLVGRKEAREGIIKTLGDENREIDKKRKTFINVRKLIDINKSEAKARKDLAKGINNQTFKMERNLQKLGQKESKGADKDINALEAKAGRNARKIERLGKAEKFPNLKKTLGGFKNMFTGKY